MKITLQKLVDNKLFEWSVVAVIIISALLIGAKTYRLSPLTEQIILFADWAVTLFFLAEIMARFIACDNKKRFFHNDSINKNFSDERFKRFKRITALRGHNASAWKPPHYNRIKSAVNARYSNRFTAYSAHNNKVPVWD